VTRVIVHERHETTTEDGVAGLEKATLGFVVYFDCCIEDTNDHCEP